MFRCLCLEAVTHLLVDFFGALRLSSPREGPDTRCNAAFVHHAHSLVPLSQVPAACIASLEPYDNTAPFRKKKKKKSEETKSLLNLCTELFRFHASNDKSKTQQLGSSELEGVGNHKGNSA